MKTTLAFAFAAVTTASICGCGGSSSTVFGEGGSGGGGGGTTTGTAGCPDQMPNNGDSCFLVEGLTCNYGECCPAMAQCVNGEWQIAVSGCAEQGCPYEPPAQGEACDSACGPSSCSWSGVCSDGTGTIDATCTAGGWSVSTAVCPTSFACGPELMCAASDVCVATTGGGPSGDPSYACQPNPCGAVVDCGCAAPVCGELQCTGVTGHTVSCECTVCG